jgi:hypothetical protein
LKKVSKYENKFAKLQKKAAEFNFRNQLKVVKKKEFTLEEEDKEVRIVHQLHSALKSKSSFSISSEIENSYRQSDSIFPREIEGFSVENSSALNDVFSLNPFFPRSALLQLPSWKRSQISLLQKSTNQKQLHSYPIIDQTTIAFSFTF